MPQKLLRKLSSRLGRRGGVLVIFGVMFLLVGLDVTFSPDAPDIERFLIHTFIPHEIRALLWLIPGGLAVSAAFRKGPGPDGFGFVALVIPVIIRIVSYAFSFIAYLVGAGNWALSWASALIWILLLGLILILSGWTEVPAERVRIRTRWKGAP